MNVPEPREGQKLKHILHRWHSGLVQHLVNLHFRPAGLGAIFAERSDSKDRDNRSCQVEAVVSRNYFFDCVTNSFKYSTPIWLYCVRYSCPLYEAIL